MKYYIKTMVDVCFYIINKLLNKKLIYIINK